jgi:hypothetical protein
MDRLQTEFAAQRGWQQGAGTPSGACVTTARLPWLSSKDVDGANPAGGGWQIDSKRQESSKGSKGAGFVGRRTS